MAFIDVLEFLGSLLIVIDMRALPFLAISYFALLMSIPWLANIRQPAPNWSNK